MEEQEVTGSDISFALEARVHLALYRVLQPINWSKAYEHEHLARDFALKAFFAGQANSPLLLDESSLVKSARIHWDSANPVRSDYASWIAPLIAAFPDIGLQRLAQRLDSMEVEQWHKIGDRATCIDAGFHLNAVSEEARHFIGAPWQDALKAVWQGARDMGLLAEGRTRGLGWPSLYYVRDGAYATVCAFAELIVPSLHSGPLSSSHGWCMHELLGLDPSWATSTRRS